MRKEGDADTVLVNHTIERILYPTDLSPEADKTLAYAVALARTYGAKLFLCHCLEQANENKEKHVKEVLAAMLATYLDTSEDTLKWDILLIHGEAANAIIAEARKRHIDFIVMHSRRRPYAAALLGSTAESICRQATCPVLVTHAQERECLDAHTGKLRLKHVLVPYDFSPYAENSLDYALSLAQSQKSQIHLLHVIPNYPEMPWRATSKTSFHRTMRRLQSVIDAYPQSLCKMEAIVREGQPYRELLVYAEEHSVDLICMGAHGSGFGEGTLFGSNTDRVLRQSPCPVLITRPEKKSN